MSTPLLPNVDAGKWVEIGQATVDTLLMLGGALPLTLLIGLPLYIVVAVTLMNWLDARFGRLPILAEFAVYVGLGILWVLPFKRVFSGIGRGE